MLAPFAAPSICTTLPAFRHLSSERCPIIPRAVFRSGRRGRSTHLHVRAMEAPCTPYGAALSRRNAVSSAFAAALASGAFSAEDANAALVTVRPNLPFKSALLHVVLNVPDVPAAAEFFTQVGMSVLRQRPGNIFVGYGPETKGDHFVIELAQGGPDATVGENLDHLLIATDEPDTAMKRALAAGGVPARAYAGRTPAVEGPAGIKLVFTSDTDLVPDPLCRLILNVNDAETSRLFLQGLGMTFFETRTQTVTGLRSIVMGYKNGPRTGQSLEVVQSRGRKEPIQMSDGYNRIAISTTDMEASLDRVRLAIQKAEEANVPAGRILREPFRVPNGTLIAEVADPTGNVFALVDAADFENELA